MISHKLCVAITIGSLFFSILLCAEDTLLKIVGLSADQVVTNRDVDIDRVIESILYDKNLSDFASHIDQVLLEYAIYKEARTSGLSRISKRELRYEIQKFNIQLKSNKNLYALWRDLGVLNSELRPLINKKLHVKKFIKFKQQSSLVPITDKEALDYYQRQKDKYNDTDFSKISDQIKATLSKQRAESRMKQWYLDLKTKHKISKI